MDGWYLVKVPQKQFPDSVSSILSTTTRTLDSATILAPERQTYCSLRNVLPVDVLRSLREYWDDCDESRVGFRGDERDLRALRLGVMWDALRLNPRWFEALRAPADALLDVTGTYEWAVYPPQLRKVRSMSHQVPWHQDVAYQRLLGTRRQSNTITIWIPLDEDPYNRMTVQFSADAVPELAHSEVDVHGAGVSLEPSHREHFRLHLGDCLVFGDHVLHRTYLPADAQVERHSLEFRLIRKCEALEEKDYFDILQGAFVRTDGYVGEKPL